MRQLKWAGLAFVMGSLIMLSPDYSPAQFQFKKGRGDGDSGGGKGFGKGGFGGDTAGGFGKRGDGGFGKGGFGGGDGGGKGGFGGGRPGGFGDGGYGNPQGNYGGGQPGGFGGGQPRGSGGGGQPGGFGGGGQGFGGGQPGGFGGQGGGGRPPFDPNMMWDNIARGQESIDLNDPQFSRWKEQMLQRGEPLPPNGLLTRQMFVEGIQQRMAARGNTGGGGGPGGPMGGGFGGPGGGGNDRDRGLERLRQQDADNDGRISRAEADRQLQPNFERIDVSGDGFITLEEYRGYYASTQQGGGGGGRDRGPGGMGPGGFGPGGFGPGGDGNFGGDRGNWGEGRVSEETKPVAMRYGHLPKDLPPWFDRDDANKDGQVALHEWRLARKNLDEFIKYDLNSDGLLTADELLRFNFQQAEDARIAAYNDPDNPDNPKPAFAMKRGNGGGGFALPGSTPAPPNGYNRPQGKGDRPQGERPQGERPQGKGDRKNNNDERAPDGGNGGMNPFRRSKN
jgi:hypothetical protein